MADLSKCQITATSSVTFTQLSSLNTGVLNTVLSLYIKSNTRKDGSILAYSTQDNSVPITATKVDWRPCFYPKAQTTLGIYLLELQRSLDCPVDINSNL